MDLTQLANLGEFIGGIAVLATLVYLAVQVRQSRVLAVAVAQRDINGAHRQNLDRIIRYPEAISNGTS